MKIHLVYSVQLQPAGHAVAISLFTYTSEPVRPGGECLPPYFGLELSRFGEGDELPMMQPCTS
jgi:hypothetical protein